MFSFFSRPAAGSAAAGTAAPAVDAAKCFPEKLPSHSVIFECYEDLKRSKAGVADLSDLFEFVDNVRHMWDNLVSTAHTLRPSDIEEAKATFGRKTAQAESLLKEGKKDLLTRQEIRLVSRYLTAVENQAKSALIRGATAAAAAARTAARADATAARAVGARNAAAEALRTAEVAGAAAVGAAAAGHNALAARLLANTRRAARNVRSTTREAERAEASVAGLFTRNAARSNAARAATNAALATYAAPAVAGAGTAAAPARASVPAGRFAPLTGAPSEYAGGRRRTRRNRRKVHKSRKAHRKGSRRTRR